jgi:hypothetical protein
MFYHVAFSTLRHFLIDDFGLRVFFNRQSKIGNPTGVAASVGPGSLGNPGNPQS